MTHFREIRDAVCVCGRLAFIRLHVHYRYPRAGYEPMAADPHYVHGGGYSLMTCGDLTCEADAFLACRAQIVSLASLPVARLSAEQIAGLELAVHSSPGEGIKVLGDGEDDAA